MKQQSRIIFGALILAGVVSLGITAWILFPEQMPKFPQLPEVFQPPPAKIVIPRNTQISTEVTQDVAQWSVFTGKYFTFKYPPEWKAHKVTEEKVTLYSPDLLEPPKGTPISVYTLSDQTYEESIKKISGVLTNSTQDSVSTPTLIGTEIKGTLNIRNYGDVNMTIAILKADDRSIIIEYAAYSDATDYSKAYQDIVQSIQATQ